VNVGARQSDNLVLRFGPFEADIHTSELRKSGRLVALPPQPFKVLALLANRSGELVTREEIQKDLWGGDTFVDFEQGLNFCIKRIRAALGDDADKPRYIETLPRRGYRFVATVERISPPQSTKDEGPKLVVMPVQEAPPIPIQASPSLQRPKLPTSSTEPLTLGSTALWQHSKSAEAHPVAVSLPAQGSLSRFPRRRRNTLWIVLSAIIVVAISLVLIEQGRLRWRWSHPLTEKDTIVLADFANNTSDPVFGDALKAGLSADLNQSTFLNILSDDLISKQLRYMGRNDATLPPDVAREVCQRAGSQVMLVGSISSIGSHYSIALKAVDCKNGDSLDVEEAEADRRESVLSRLHQLAGSMRKRLGESLASVEKHDAPLEQATTSSLEALQTYSLGERTSRAGDDSAAARQFKRALELDPNFVTAMVDLGVTYCNLNERELCAEYVSKAYQLRDRITERERFSVDSNYYTDATGELEKAAQALTDWKESYPRDLAPIINLSEVEWELGRLDMALTNDLQGLMLKKDSTKVYGHLSSDYMSLNRLDEAKASLDEARVRKLDAPLIENYYQLAFLRNDEKEMERYVAAVQGKSEDESMIFSSQSDTDAFYGHLRKARDFSRRAVASALSAGDKEAAAGWEVTEAIREAEFGNANDATKHTNAALALASTRNVQVAAAIAFARAGDIRRAQTISGALQKRFPSDTLLLDYWLPSIRAAIALANRKPADAVDFLQTVSTYELGGNVLPFSQGASMYPVYLRGEAYLQLKQWESAAGEFQRIVDHRGLVWNFPFGALVQLQLARSYSQGNQTAKTRETYEKFLTLWHDADPDIPIFRRATAEYSALAH
jgi:eukaryotic-like serine/threonine-protein kinase